MKFFSTVVGKLKTVAIDNVNKDEMKVRWRLDCSDRVGIVTGYNISYCAIADDSAEGDCVGREMHQTTGPDKEQLWITGLKPWTYYKVGVAVVTRAGESEISDLLVNRTERDRPGSAPTKFNTVMLSKNKVQLSWGPPEVPNGPIDFYQVGVLQFKTLQSRFLMTDV